jgi:hypothetical protein
MQAIRRISVLRDGRLKPVSVDPADALATHIAPHVGRLWQPTREGDDEFSQLLQDKGGRVDFTLRRFSIGGLEKCLELERLRGGCHERDVVSLRLVHQPCLLVGPVGKRRGFRPT